VAVLAQPAQKSTRCHEARRFELSTSGTFIDDRNLVSPDSSWQNLQEVAFASLQMPASYDLEQVIEAVQSAKHVSHARG
jgi:hypothetical protein